MEGIKQVIRDLKSITKDLSVFGKIYIYFLAITMVSVAGTYYIIAEISNRIWKK